MKVKKTDPFTINGVTYRLIGRFVKEFEKGYIEPAEVMYNVLQKQYKYLWGMITVWKDSETEVVPSFAWIAKMTIGDSGWKSPLLNSIYNKSHKIFQ